MSEMERLIAENQSLRQQLAEAKQAYSNLEQHCISQYNKLEDENELLRAELAKNQAAREWIDVKDRLPEFSRIVHRRILIWDGFSVREAWFDGDHFKEWDATGIPENIQGVTAWQNLPEPPSELRALIQPEEKK